MSLSQVVDPVTGLGTTQEAPAGGGVLIGGTGRPLSVAGVPMLCYPTFSTALGPACGDSCLFLAVDSSWVELGTEISQWSWSAGPQAAPCRAQCRGCATPQGVLPRPEAVASWVLFAGQYSWRLVALPTLRGAPILLSGEQALASAASRKTWKP